MRTRLKVKLFITRVRIWAFLVFFLWSLVMFYCVQVVFYPYTPDWKLLQSWSIILKWMGNDIPVQQASSGNLMNWLGSSYYDSHMYFSWKILNISPWNILIFLNNIWMWFLVILFYLSFKYLQIYFNANESLGWNDLLFFNHILSSF